MAQFVAEQWVAAPIEVVFAYFCDPANFPKIMPKELDVRLVGLKVVAPERVVQSGPISERVAGKGTELDLRFRFVPGLPFRGRWLARIVEFEWQSFFKDVQVIGPFKNWVHTHSFERAVQEGREGTLLRDIIEFEVGYGVLGRAIGRFFIEPRLRNTFAHRRAEIEKMLRSARENQL